MAAQGVNRCGLAGDAGEYGPTPTDGNYHWYQLPATIAGNTATFSITDGGLGDNDLTDNGTIVDQAPACRAAARHPSPHCPNGRC